MKITPINAQNLQYPSSQRETSTSKTTGKPIDTRKTSTPYSSNVQIQPRGLHSHNTPPLPQPIESKDQQANSRE